MRRAEAQAPTAAPLRPPVRCACGHLLFDGQVIKSRIIQVQAQGALAKCRCKRWIAVPVTYSPVK